MNDLQVAIGSYSYNLVGVVWLYRPLEPTFVVASLFVVTSCSESFPSIA